MRPSTTALQKARLQGAMEEAADQLSLIATNADAALEDLQVALAEAGDFVTAAKEQLAAAATLGRSLRAVAERLPAKKGGAA